MWNGGRTSAYYIMAHVIPYCNGISSVTMVVAIDWLPLAIYDMGMHLIASKQQITRNGLCSDLPMGYMKLTVLDCFTLEPYTTLIITILGLHLSAALFECNWNLTTWEQRWYILVGAVLVVICHLSPILPSSFFSPACQFYSTPVYRMIQLSSGFWLDILATRYAYTRPSSSIQKGESDILHNATYEAVQMTQFCAMQLQWTS